MNHPQNQHQNQQQNQQHQPPPALPGSFPVANIHNTGMMPTMIMKVPRKHQQQNHSMNNGFPPPAAGLVTSISSSLVSNTNSVSVSYAQPPHAQPPHAQFHSAVAPASALNLPPGVFIPQSIDQNLILASPKAMELLHSLSPKQMQDSLKEFDEAMRSKAGKVRNITAYLIGVFKRYVNVNSKHRKSGAPVMLEGLTPIVRVTLQKMVDSGFCTKADVSDPKVEQKLKMLSEHDAVLAIDELSSVPRVTIRNFASYFSGILNRYQRGQTGNGNGHGHGNGHGNGNGNGNGNGTGNAGGSGRFDDKRGGRSRHVDRPSDRDRHRDSPSRDSHDDDRRRHRSRRNRSHSDDYSRSPSPDRNYRRRNRRERSRSRSRDRFDGDGGGRRSRRYHRSRSTSPGRHGDRNSHSNSLGGHHYEPQGVPMVNAPVPIQGGHMMNQPPPMMFGGAPPMGGVMGYLPPPPPPRPTMQMHQQQLQLPSTVQPHHPWQHQMQQQQMPYSYPPGPTAAAVAAPLSNPALAPAPLFHHTNPTSQITGPSTLDILGLAEKAAQALSGFSSLTPAPATRVDPRQTAVVHTNHVPIQTNHVQNHHVPIQTNHAHIQHVPIQTNHAQNHHVSVQRDPRSVNVNPSNPISKQTNDDENIHVTVNDLSPMIQYSLQNLKSSGFLEKELGQNGCRWLKKLPEPLALQALERFSSLEKDLMRSKEGYLCGILKKAVDKRGL